MFSLIKVALVRVSFHNNRMVTKTTWFLIFLIKFNKLVVTRSYGEQTLSFRESVIKSRSSNNSKAQAPFTLNKLLPAGAAFSEIK